MRVDDTTKAVQTLTSAENSAALRGKLQMSLLRKSLDSQQEQTAELLKLLEGKGNVIDIRA